MPHKITTIKRYRISNDVLILILEKLTPVALYRTCQAFERVWLLVMEFQHLRYRFELAILGMKDGPATYATRSPMMRLQLLLAYKKDWPRLKWAEEQKVRVPGFATQVNVSGNFLYYVANQVLDLIELPSCRTGRPSSQTRHIKYNSTPDADCVVVDPLQSLIVTSHTYAGSNGQINLRLKIRNLWTFEKHPRASSPYYDCSTHVAQPIANVSISVCGTRMVSTLEFANGLTKHLLMDWSTLQAMWLEEQDVVLLNPYLLLGVRKAHNKLALYLYNISDMRKVAIEREYELPPIWINATMRFGKNSSPNTDAVTPSNALFYSDPAARVLLLSAKQPGPNAAMYWMFIPESFFRPTVHDDRRSVPWNYWNHFCLIRELQAALVVGNPHVIGSRVVYLEKDGTRSTSGMERSRLKIIDFAPYADVPPPSTKAWTLFGKYATIKPGEYQRDFSSSTTNGLAVASLAATEDNIVLVLENHGDLKPVNILTFGPPPPQKVSRQDIQYHPSL